VLGVVRRERVIDWLYVSHNACLDFCEGVYKVTVTANSNSSWIETMKLYMTRTLDSHDLGAKTLALLSAAWGPYTLSSNVRPFYPPVL
jgi:hypothetical protein